MPVRRKKIKSKYNNKLSRKIHIRKNNKKPLFITLVIVMIISLGVTISLAGLSGLDKDINTLDAQIADLEKTKQSLLGEVSEIKSSSDIEREAMYKLGMVYPKEDQIVYVDLSKNKEGKDVNNNVFLSPIYSVLKSFTKN